MTDLQERVAEDLETWPTRADVQMLLLACGFAALGFLAGVQFLASTVETELAVGVWMQYPDAAGVIGDRYRLALLFGTVVAGVGLVGGVWLEDGGDDT